jgi:hypothetical protein
MGGLDVLGAFEIRDGAGDFEDAGLGPGCIDSLPMPFAGRIGSVRKARTRPGALGFWHTHGVEFAIGFSRTYRF